VRQLDIVLVLVLLAALIQPVASRLDLPLALAQVVGGVLLSVVPAVRELEINPELTFTLFVPPLLFWASLTGSLRDVRRNARAILLLAVALVLITMISVAIVAHAVVPSLPWASAFVLGAIVAPPDADVTTSIARRLGLPPRIVTVLEGETLLNDTVAFVSYRLAVSAAVIGTFSLSHAAGQFVVSAVGGVATGLAVGWLVFALTKLMSDPLVATTIGLVTPFAAYVLAERFGGSGVLAVVTAGFCFSRFVPRTLSARTRVRGRAVWETIIFWIGGLVFTLIGVQLGRFAPAFWQRGGSSLLASAALVSATVIGVRIVWVVIVAYMPRFTTRREASSQAFPSWRAVAVVGWAGLRGGDTLVMILAVPYVTAAGAPFPHRTVVIAIAYGVTLATLVLQGLTLRPLIKRLAIPHDDVVEVEERRARLEAARAAIRHLTQIAARDGLSPAAVKYLRRTIRERTRLDLDEIDHADGHDGRTNEDIVRQAEHELRNAARAAVVRLRDDNVIGQEALRRVQSDLDLDEVRRIELS
jgi:CPA1 family monovalent cation:H+ antiporter